MYTNQEGAVRGSTPSTRQRGPHRCDEDPGPHQALDKYKFDAAFGGARRDEEKSRAKERVFSFRTGTTAGTPRTSDPSSGTSTTQGHKGESIRVFPLSNWTELDVWQYIHLESIPIVPLYLSTERPVVDRDGVLIMLDDDRMRLEPGETPMKQMVRFRTLGCYPLYRRGRVHRVHPARNHSGDAAHQTLRTTRTHHRLRRPRFHGREKERRERLHAPINPISSPQTLTPISLRTSRSNFCAS